MLHEGNLASYCERILASQTIEEAWQTLGSEMEGYGFNRMMFGMNSVNSDGRLGDITDSLLLVRGEQAYVDAYLEGEFYKTSPFIQWAASHRGSLSWRDPNCGLTPESLNRIRPGLIELMRGVGLRAGYNISLADPQMSEVAVLSLSARAEYDQDQVDEIWKEVGKPIELTSTLFYLRIKALPRPVQLRPLTSRQKEVLTWAAAGKTTRDIATIMDISIATVDKHLRSVRTALNVVSTTQAVQKATRFNLI